MSHLKQPSKAVWPRFWEALGGWETLVKDGYLWVALGLATCTFPIWIQALWWDWTTNVLAIQIGFSVSGFSVALTVIDKLKDRLFRRSKWDGSSPFVNFIAGYVHYLLVGFLALGSGLICKAWYLPELSASVSSEFEYAVVLFRIGFKFAWLVSGFLFCYSLTSAVRCVMSIFRFSDLVQRAFDHEEKMELRRQLLLSSQENTEQTRVTPNPESADD